VRWGDRLFSDTKDKPLAELDSDFGKTL